MGRKGGKQRDPAALAPQPPPPTPPATARLLRSLSAASGSAADGGNGRQMLQIVQHFGLRAGILLGVWGVQRLVFNRRKAGASPGAQQQQKPQGVKAKDTFKIMYKPASEYQVVTPQWITDALLMDDEALAADPSWQCPLLQQFKAGLKGGELSVAFGAACRRELFCLDPDFVHLNHGSYGGAFRLSLEVQRWYSTKLELGPNLFMDTIAIKGMLSAMSVAAGLLRCHQRDVVPAVNATSACQAVINGLKLRRGDLILICSTTYAAIKSMVVRAAADAGAGVITVHVTMQHMQQPLELLAAFQLALDAGHGRVRLAVLDHIPSFPPIVMPVRQLAALCRKAGAKVLVDGAHGVGALPDIDVPAMGVHFYTSNLHKWCCCPKGTAVLWVTPEEQDAVRPLVVSHAYGLGFRAEWSWQATRDCSAWLAVPAALAVMQALGPTRIAQHNHSLVQEGAALLQKRWGTHPVLSGTGGPNGGGALCPMAALPLPSLRGRGVSPTDASTLHVELQSVHRIELPVFSMGGRLWVRISAQIYNVLGDYEALGNVVAAMMVEAPADGAATGGKAGDKGPAGTAK